MSLDPKFSLKSFVSSSIAITSKVPDRVPPSIPRNNGSKCFGVTRNICLM